MQIDTVLKAGPCRVASVLFGPNIPIISSVKGAQIKKSDKIPLEISRSVTVTRHFLVFRKMRHEMKADNICIYKHIWIFSKNAFLILL